MSKDGPHSTELSLIAYAKKNRFRLRNLHDGGPCPPAKWWKPRGTAPVAQVGFVADSDRFDVVVGLRGYLCQDDKANSLGIFVEFKTSRGVSLAAKRIAELGGTVQQIGDTELAGTIPVHRLEDGLSLIKVSRLPVGNRNAKPPTRSRDTVAA